MAAASHAQSAPRWKARATANSTAAEEDRPAPTGTSPSRTLPQPASERPESASAQAVPFTYSNQPSPAGVSSVTSLSEKSFFCKIHGVNSNLIPSGIPTGDIHGAIYGHGHDKAVVVVGVFANQDLRVPARAHNPIGRTLVAVGKGRNCAIQRHSIFPFLSL